MDRLAVFDLDGTLVDSVPDLQAALDRMMAPRGRRGFTRAEVTAMVGDGAAALVSRALAARGLAPDPGALAAFLADYGAHAAVLTRAFPGIPDVLDGLAAAGWRLAVCTNKPLAPARALLDQLGLLGRFAAVLGGDSGPARKPDPAHLLATIGAARSEPARAVMIGDHRNDIAAARGAGVAALFCAWGYGTAEMAEGAAVAAMPGDLPALLERLVPTAPGQV